MTPEKEILELERKYWTAIKEKAADAAVALTDNPCIVTGAQGFSSIDPKTFRKMMEDSFWELKEFELKDDAQVRLVKDDVAIVAYTVKECLMVEGKPVTLEAADSSMWVRREGRWLCALHTEAITGDPFGRDKRTVH